MHVTLYRKYRSTDFEDVAGQKDIVKSIKNSLRTGMFAHAFLFTGPRGVGKTTLARLIAKGLNCLKNGITDTPCNQCENCLSITDGSFLDMVEIDAASNRGIDEIRDLKDKVNYKPSKGRKKVYIIDEVHMLTKEAFNALLKTLEEPPIHAVFILATTEADKVLPTIVSRCQRYDFKTLSNKEMVGRLKHIATNEKINISDEALDVVYEASGGSMRDSISILERVYVNYLDESITPDKVEDTLGITSSEKLKRMIALILEKNKVEVLKFLDELWLESLDIESFFKDLGKLSKNMMSREELSIDLGLEIISTIYDTISKFKFEEDKRLVGYVIIDKLLNKRENLRVVRESKEIEKVPDNFDSIKSIDKKSTSRLVSIEEIKKMWPEIIKHIRKEKIVLLAYLVEAKFESVKDNNVVVVAYSNQNSFAGEQLKKENNKEILTRIISNVIGENISIEVEIRGKVSKDRDLDTEEFTDQVINFFGGGKQN